MVAGLHVTTDFTKIIPRIHLHCYWNNLESVVLEVNITRVKTKLIYNFFKSHSDFSNIEISSSRRGHCDCINQYSTYHVACIFDYLGGKEKHRPDALEIAPHAI